MAKKYKYKVEKVICRDEKGNLYEWQHQELEEELKSDVNYWGEQQPIREYKIIKDE